MSTMTLPAPAAVKSPLLDITGLIPSDLPEMDPEVFREAAQIIRTGGLAQGHYETDQGQHCAMGALMAATGTRSYKVARYGNVLADLLGVPCWTHVMTWNDTPGRTAEDVAGLFDAAYEKLAGDR